MRKLLLISGASKGIGYATVKLFLDKGHQVVNVSRTPCDIDGVSNLAIDLMQRDWPDMAADALRSACEDYERIALVHNAAMMTKDSVSDLRSDSLRDVLELNVVAAAQLNRLVLPMMNDGSSIIYISSTLGTKAVAGTHAYVVSKHAMVGQMRATCQDLAGTQIHTACICPGFTETEMLQQHLGKNPDLHDQITAQVALGRLVQPNEIAHTIWFASQNPVINGALIDANLGQIER